MRFREVEKIILADGWIYKNRKALIASTYTHQSRARLQSQNTPETFHHRLSNKFLSRPDYNVRCCTQ